MRTTITLILGDDLRLISSSCQFHVRHYCWAARSSTFSHDHRNKIIIKARSKTLIQLQIS